MKFEWPIPLLYFTINFPSSVHRNSLAILSHASHKTTVTPGPAFKLEWFLPPNTACEGMFIGIFRPLNRLTHRTTFTSGIWICALKSWINSDYSPFPLFPPEPMWPFPGRSFHNAIHRYHPKIIISTFKWNSGWTSIAVFMGTRRPSGKVQATTSVRHEPFGWIWMFGLFPPSESITNRASHHKCIPFHLENIPSFFNSPISPKIYPFIAISIGHSIVTARKSGICQNGQ